MLKRAIVKKAIVGASSLAAMAGAVAFGSGGPASAATAISYGFDGNAHLVVIGGSDTVYTTLTGLGDLWQKDFTVNNITTGTNNGDTCAVSTSDAQNTSGTYPAPSNAPVANQYSNHQLNSPNPSPTATNPALTNCNHDTIANAYPAGSSTGISTLNGGGGATPAVFPYEGTNSNATFNAPASVTGFNGGGAITPSTAITSVTVATLAAPISNGDTLQISNGSTSQNLSVTASASPGSNVTISATGTALDNYGTTGSTAKDTSWATMTNGYGTPDLARSSRQPKTSSGKCPGTVSSTHNELACDTFWGFASDEVQVFSWNFGSAVSRGQELQLLGGGLTADDLYNIWNCTWTKWSQIPGLSSVAGFVDGPIVPWGMNSGSGTQGTFQSWIINNATASAPPSTWTTNGQACDRALSSGTVPFENDTKPLLTDANIAGDPRTNPVATQINGSASAVTSPTPITSVTIPVPTDIAAGQTIVLSNGTNTLSLTASGPVAASSTAVTVNVNSVAANATYTPTSATVELNPAGVADNANSTQDPSNWIWWGSFGLMSAYQFNSQPLLPSVNANQFTIEAAPIYNPGATGSPPIQLASSCSGGTGSEPACTGSNGNLPSTSSIGKYPLSRDLYMVSPKTTADCPIGTAGTCDLTGTPAAGQPGDIQVNGASGGSAGAAREFLRFLCRNSSTQQQLDPFSAGDTGVNFSTEISGVLTANGFAGVPLKSTLKPLTEGFQTNYKAAGLGRSAGTSCSVLSVVNTTPSP